ncbi:MULTISPECIES: pentapeptide repeat-containing protein [unclassified Streptomyces]|uniref:pentapeptide repeat-containing protein n=1 Tax=unclassified Streptomyces TaxID=2593676 RepID=UPI0015CF3B02|nr:MULTISPECIES: pentapeptide repeat-containing protein [unclassified Streptomyces]MBK3546363.1 pentapeptide repeat-containing protein [Streptomyces sp. MBT60]
MNLRSAVLLEVDFSECIFIEPEFEGARFTGQARFSGATFHGTAGFAHAKFDGYAAFDGAEFFGHMFSHDAAYKDIADFRGSAFHRQFHLAREEFAGQAWFTDSEFHADARFVNPAFPRAAPIFHAGIDLTNARIWNTSEVVMPPTGWAVEEEDTSRVIVSENSNSSLGAARNRRPPYPRQGQAPDPRWTS